LQHRGFRLLFYTTVAAQFGEQIQTFANLWQIYELTSSALHIGLNGVARAIPVLLFSLAGGVIADRVDRKKIIVLTQVANGTFALILGILSVTGHIEVWHVYAATALNAALSSVSAPARRAVIAGLVPRQHLMNAMAMNSSVNQLDRIVAPSIGGILIAVLGLPFAYWVTAVARIVTALGLARVPLGQRSERAHGSPLMDLKEGLMFVRVRSIILVLVLLDVLATLFGSYRGLLPIIADQFETGPVGFGVLSSAPGVGSLVGVGVIMVLGDFPFKGRLIAGAILAYAGFVAVLAISPVFVVAVLATACLGLTDSIQAVARNGTIQLMTPDALRGRVASFQHMVTSGGPALGQTLMGASAGALGAPLALLVGAASCAAIAIAVIVGRKDLSERSLGATTETDTVSSTERRAGPEPR
jgi:MFS family permease